MNRAKSFLCLSALTLGLGAFALAQPADKKHDGMKEAAHAAPPEGMPDMEAMMAAYVQAATPGPMHERLTSTVGVWDGKIKSYMNPDPNAAPQESTSVATITAIMGGRFTHCEVRGEMDMGPMGKHEFIGGGIYGYNNTTEEFESTWIDNLGTLMVHFTGKLSDDGKTLTWTGHYTDPMSKQKTWMKNIEKETGPDTMVMEMWGPGMDGKDMKMMEIHSTRRPGTGPKPAADKPKDAKPAAAH